MKLTKMHGLGNDFILFSDSQGANKDYTDLAIRLCDRRTGSRRRWSCNRCTI